MADAIRQNVDPPFRIMTAELTPIGASARRSSFDVERPGPRSGAQVVFQPASHVDRQSRAAYTALGMLNRAPHLDQDDLFEGRLGAPHAHKHFPKTRYQGSKRRLLPQLRCIFRDFAPGTAVDLYSGTATVSLLLRTMGWRVVANDYLLFNNAVARLMLEGPPVECDVARLKTDLAYLLHDAPLNREPLVADSFGGIYFADDENLQIDRFCQNVASLPQGFRDLYIYAVGQALMMKRPYNLFHRANLDMRTRKVARSFGNVTTWNRPILEHAVRCAAQLLRFCSASQLPRGAHMVTTQNTLDLAPLPDSADLVYLDPPYLNGKGVGVDYCHFYHFLDGLCDYRLFANRNHDYAHKPIVLKPSAWLDNIAALDEIARILDKWPRANIVLSYRSDGRPRFEEISEVFRSRGRALHPGESLDYKYVLSHSTGTKELFLISEAA
jgi:adenine-specific DNA-methyltransferase